ncbi:MAG: HAD family hydrolase [Anaerolineales bacterium]|jgi:HAD superfamily hydrolase (TIGR01509 family)|nr:HAD family hydrolase [Anaerolineales bacterium]
MIEALIFDFDGLILDTEIPIFHSWQELYRRHGLYLPFEKWAVNIGTAEMIFNPMEELIRLAKDGKDFAPEFARRRAHELELIHNQPPLPGVEDYLEDARRLGLKLGLASSSSGAWVNGHIARLGLREYFSCVHTGDDVLYTKPDPALYRLTLDCLGVAPQNVIAFEDSRNGALAAKRAGIFVVVVPNSLTRLTDTSLADLALDSLADLPLADLIKQVDAILAR